MAFVHSDDWNEAAASLPRARHTVEFSALGGSDVRTAPALAHRVLAASLASLIAFGIMLTMTFDASSLPRDLSTRLTMITLTPPPPQRPRHAAPSPQPRSAPAGGAEREEMASSALPLSPSPPPAPGLLQWLQTRIAVMRPSSLTAAPADPHTGEGPGPAEGNGSSGVYDPYAGAAPSRRDAIGGTQENTALHSGIAPSLGTATGTPNSAGSSAATLGARLNERLGGRQGRAHCRLTRAQSGIIVTAWCDHISGDATKPQIEHALVGLSDESAREGVESSSEQTAGWIDF